MIEAPHQLTASGWTGQRRRTSYGWEATLAMPRTASPPTMASSSPLWTRIMTRLQHAAPAPPPMEGGGGFTGDMKKGSLSVL